jgi:hypothetical protein
MNDKRVHLSKKLEFTQKFHDFSDKIGPETAKTW